MPDNGLGPFAGMFGVDGVMPSEALNPTRFAPPGETDDSGMPVPRYTVTAASPITDDEIRDFAARSASAEGEKIGQSTSLLDAVLGAISPGLPSFLTNSKERNKALADAEMRKQIVANEIDRARKDPTGDAAQRIRAFINASKHLDEVKDKDAQDAYIRDINENGVASALFMPEIGRAASGFASGLKGQVFGIGAELQRDFPGALAGAADNVRRIMFPTQMGVMKPAFQKAYEEHKTRELMSGVTPGQGQANVAFDALGGAGSASADYSAQLNREASDIQNYASYARYFQDPDHPIKSAIMGAAADTPFNIVQMAPMMIAGAGLGGLTNAAATEAGIAEKSIQWTNPLTKKAVTINVGKLPAYIVATFPEAMGEANQASLNARRAAVEQGVDPNVAAKDAWINTFAGNVGLLTVTNHFGDGRVMMETFLKSGADAAAEGTAKALATTAKKRFGSKLIGKAIEVAKEMGKEAAPDFISEGLEEYLQNIISSMAGNPKANTWEDVKKAAFSPDALSQFVGGALSGVVVGEGSRMIHAKTYGRKMAEEEGVVKPVEAGRSGLSPVAPTAIRTRPVGDLMSSYQEAMTQVQRPTELSNNQFGRALYDAAGLSNEEIGLAKELSRMVHQAHGMDPFVYANVNTPGAFEGEQGQAKLASLKAVYDKLLDGQHNRLRSAATADFMSSLDENEIESFNKAMKEGLPAAQVQTEEPGQAAPIATTATPQLAPEAVSQLGPAHAELQQRKAAIDQHLENSKAVDEAMAADEAGGEKFNQKKYDATVQKLNDAMKTLSPQAAFELLSTDEKAQLRAGQGREDRRAKAKEALRAKLYELEHNDVVAKYGNGHAGFSEALRSYDPSVMEGPIPIEMMPDELARARSIRPLAPAAIPNLVANSSIQSRIEAVRRTLGKTLSSLPEHVQAAARRHGATSIKMAKALKMVMSLHENWNETDSKRVQSALDAMQLTKAEQNRVTAAAKDAFSMKGMAEKGPIDLASDLLERYNQDVNSGVSHQAASINALNYASGNPTVTDILQHGFNLGLTARTVLDTIKAAGMVARAERVSVKGGDLKSEINAALGEKAAADEQRRINEFANTKEFASTVKDLLTQKAHLASGDESVPAGTFDLKTAKGKVLNLAYGYAMRYVQEQRSKWMGWIGRKGSTLAPENYGWTNSKVKDYVNRLMAEAKKGAPLPKDEGKKNGKSRAWAINDADMAEIVRVLVSNNVIEKGADGKNRIVGIGNPRDLEANIDRSAIVDAFKRAPYGGTATTVRIPTMEELTSGLDPKQVMALEMYHGLNAFAGNYMSFSQIGKALNMSEEAAARQVQYAQSVIAARFPNTRLLAESLANRVSRLMDRESRVGASFDEDVASERSDLLAELGVISRLPGAFTSYTHAGNAANESTRTDAVINKGFFPSIHDAIIDADADPASVAKRDELHKAYVETRDAYNAVAKKPERFRTAEDNNKLNALYATYSEAREKYFAAVGAIYHAVSQETMDKLAFVDSAIVRRGVGVERSGNVREVGVIKLIDKLYDARVDDAEHVGRALSQVLLETAEQFGIPAYELNQLRDDISKYAARAYMSDRATPIRSAIIAASNMIHGSYIDDMIGVERDGSSTLGKAFKENVLAIDRSARGTSFSAEYEAALKREDEASKNLEAAQKDARSARAKKAALSKRLPKIPGMHIRVSELRAEAVSKTAELVKILFASNLASSIPVNGKTTIDETIDSAIKSLTSIPNELGKDVPGIRALAADMRRFITAAPTERIGMVEGLAGRINKVQSKLESFVPHLSRIATTGSEFIKADAVALLNKIKSVVSLTKAVSNAVSMANATASIEASRLTDRQQSAMPAIRDLVNSIVDANAQADKAYAEIAQTRTVMAKANNVVASAERALRNARFEVDKATRETDRIASLSLPIDEGALAQAFGAENYGQAIEDLPSNVEGVLSEAEMEDAGLTKTQLFKAEMSSSGYAMADTQLQKIAENMFNMIGGKGGARRAMRDVEDHIKRLRTQFDELDPDAKDYEQKARSLKDQISEAREQLAAFKDKMREGGSVRVEDALNLALEEILNTAERLGLEREVSDRWDIRASLAVTGLAHIASNPNFADLISKGREVSFDETIGPLSAMMRAADPSLDASLAHTMAEGALEIITGKRRPKAKINLGSIVEAFSDPTSEVSKVVSEEQAASVPEIPKAAWRDPEELVSKAEAMAKGKVTLDSAAKINKMLDSAERNSAPGSSIHETIAAIRKTVRESVRGTKNQGGEKVKMTAHPSSDIRLSGIVGGVDLLAVHGLASTSPEGAAVMLAAGIGYVAYKLGMANPTFAGIMDRIKANTRNTVAEISLKIRNAAKGIGNYVSRLMAALFKDGTRVDGGKPREDVAIKQGELSDEPMSDMHGFLTPEGDFQIDVNNRVMSDPDVFVERYTKEPATFGGRVFSFDILVSRLLADGGGLFSWLRKTDPAVAGNYWRMIDTAMAKAADDGQRVAVVVGPNGAGKSTFMGSDAALNRYGVMVEASGYNLNQVGLPLVKAKDAGAIADVVYINRDLNKMIDGVIRRGIDEERLPSASGFADTLMKGLRAAVLMGNNKATGELIYIDSLTGETLSGDAAMQKMKALYQSYDENAIAQQYRNAIAPILREKENAGEQVKPAVREWLEADRDGRLSEYLGAVASQGYVGPGEREARVQGEAGAGVAPYAIHPEAIDAGPIPGTLEINADDVGALSSEEESALLDVKSKDDAIQYLNSGLNMTKALDDMVEGVRKWAADRKSNRARRSQLDTMDKKFVLFVHRFGFDPMTRIMDKVIAYMHDRDALIGAAQPVLGDLEEFREKHRNDDVTGTDQYSMLGRAMMDSSVQERVIQDAELRSKYSLEDDGIALYKKVRTMLASVREVTMAAFQRSMEREIAALRMEQDALDPNTDGYGKAYDHIEDRISEVENEAEALTSIIKKNPYFISLTRNEKGTRRLEMVDKDNKRIGMILVDTGNTNREIGADQMRDAVNQMVRQHASKLWAESGRTGSEASYVKQVQAELDRGEIKVGRSTGEGFQEGKSSQVVPDDHFNFIKMAGGIMSVDTLRNLIEKRGDGLNRDAADAMIRDLRYLIGSSEAKDRLRHSRGNIAGYSEDPIGALASYMMGAGYLAAALNHSGEIRDELDSFKRHAMSDDSMGIKSYNEMFEYVMGALAPSMKANGWTKANDKLRAFTAWKTLYAKASFAMQNGFQGAVVSRQHMMALYDTGYVNDLYRSSAAAAIRLVWEMRGLGKDLSTVDPVKLDNALNEAFNYETFKGVWASQEEADKMIPVVKAVMHELIKGPAFRDLNVGMMVGIEDVASNELSRRQGVSATKKAFEKFRDIATYGANKTENYNRLRDTISYVIACATNSRATDAGKKTGVWARYGYVSVTDNSYNRLTYDDLYNKTRLEVARQYRGMGMPKTQIDKLAYDGTVEKIMAYAMRQSAHSNFNTGRGFGTSLIWSKDGATRGMTPVYRTILIFRAYGLNVLKSWMSDARLAERRLSEEGKEPSAAWVQSHKSMAYGAIASMMLGGAFGPPMAGALADVLSAIWNWIARITGHAAASTLDIKKDYVQWVKTHMGQKTSDFMAAGLFGLTPLYGFGAQLSMGEGPVKIGKNWKETAVSAVMGANASVIDSVNRDLGRVYTGIKAGDTGAVASAAAHIAAPAGVDRVMEAASGQLAPWRRKPAGSEEFYKATLGEQIIKGLGITPYREAMIYEQDNANYFLRDRRKEIIQDIQDAMDKGAITERDYNELNQWNEAMNKINRPDMVVKPRPRSNKNKMKDELANQQRIEERMGE